ncbi:MAG TPA: biotin--[acetyl-CoA-carboxylase] ligase [Candidatus Eisenbacteria bacterium]|jgi:BirA family biotin operon repressor/biotin-[acetyl-CoA-carboxylase] ligase|nr:biotin--[acetyl-CoA-carboxylase] ligase [Candidatus Eisenbacteria bacterium]
MDLQFLGVPVERHASLGSTNDEALRRAMEGAPEGVVVLADVQTAGRGRQGRVWNDVPGASLAFSVVLRPSLPLPRLPLLALAMACSVADAAGAVTGRRHDVKWPNDVLFEGRKVCGILAESRSGGDGRPVLVIGTGVNVNHRLEDFPEEFRERAASLRQASGEYLNPESVLAAVLERFERYVTLSRDRGADALRDAVVDRLPAPGTTVAVRRGDDRVEGVVEGITETGALRFRERGRDEAIVLAAGELL